MSKLASATPQTKRQPTFIGMKRSSRPQMTSASALISFSRCPFFSACCERSYRQALMQSSGQFWMCRPPSPCSYRSCWPSYSNRCSGAISASSSSNGMRFLISGYERGAAQEQRRDSRRSAMSRWPGSQARRFLRQRVRAASNAAWQFTTPLPCLRSTFLLDEVTSALQSMLVCELLDTPRMLSRA